MLCKTLANGLLGTSRISVKSQLVMQKALLGLCWRPSPPILMVRGLGLMSAVRYVLPPCVSSELLSLLDWPVWLLAKMRPQGKDATEVEMDHSYTDFLSEFKVLYLKALLHLSLGEWSKVMTKISFMSLSSCLRGNLTAIKIRPSLKQQGLEKVGLPLTGILVTGKGGNSNLSRKERFLVTPRWTGRLELSDKMGRTQGQLIYRDHRCGPFVRSPVQSSVSL